MKHEFPFGSFRPEKNKTTYSDIPLLPEIFLWNHWKNRVPYTFQPDFLETSLYMVNNKRLAGFSIPLFRRNFSWEFEVDVSDTKRGEQLLRSGYLSPDSRFKIE